MAQNNKVILIGNLGRDAESIKTDNSEFVVFSLCTQDSYKDKAKNEWIEKKAVWHEIKVFKPYLLEDAKKLKKGERIELIGELDYEQKPDIPFPKVHIHATSIEDAPLPKKGEETPTENAA